MRCEWREDQAASVNYIGASNECSFPNPSRLARDRRLDVLRPSDYAPSLTAVAQRIAAGWKAKMENQTQAALVEESPQNV